MSIATEQTYMLDHQWEDEPRRLRLLEVLHDSASTRRLARTGVAAGWNCLEVGAGRGSIARWLGGRVGSQGCVLAIDLETDLLDDFAEPNVEVRQADVLELDLAAGSLDLIHTRAVLTHITDRRRAIERMVSWLAPGGWLVFEEIDWFGPTTGDPAWSALMSVYNDATTTVNWSCGRELLPDLTAAGLVDIGADAYVDAIRGGTPLAEWYRLSMGALRDAVLAAGTASDAEIDAQMSRLGDPAFCALGFAWVGAWGRRSGETQS